ncbi:LuxR C-terminal-related transcriptional regulator [Streptomyces sp. NPDC020379]|uniref:LuxR C-terminal-related transcriptional regulator n=1 Tax=Streptomyces sp. NPDC020379 TaxID=3365071 RepID=UPI0037945AAF
MSRSQQLCAAALMAASLVTMGAVPAHAAPARATVTARPTAYASCTQRERQVLDLVSRGYSFHQIAHILHISYNTVRALFASARMKHCSA